MIAPQHSQILPAPATHRETFAPQLLTPVCDSMTGATAAFTSVNDSMEPLTDTQRSVLQLTYFQSTAPLALASAAIAPLNASVATASQMTYLQSPAVEVTHPYRANPLQTKKDLIPSEQGQCFSTPEMLLYFARCTLCSVLCALCPYTLSPVPCTPLLVHTREIARNTAFAGTVPSSPASNSSPARLAAGR
jgi:hypothetical protein